MADDQVTAEELAALGQGGLCLNCPVCTFPNCGFWKGSVIEMEFTHFDENGNALMVDVSEKAETKREATARGSIYMSPECLKKVKEGTMAKGDVLGVARVAGIMGAKKTSELIPLCHLLNLTKLTVDLP